MNRMKIAAGAALAMTVLAALGTGVHAYVTGAKWSTVPVVFLVNPRNADVAEAAAETALRAGMDVWNLQSGSAFRYTYGGLVTDTTTGYDGRNVILFRDATNGSALATTYSWWSGSTMLDSDIVFWDGAYRFFTGTSGCSGGAYIEDIAAHELGHSLGLKHSTALDATMYPTYNYCSQALRTLASDDQAGAKFLYPATATQSNSAPSVTLASPAASSQFAYGAAITFSASAADAQDGNLTATVRWTSTIDGQIGTGGSLSRSLSVGTHVITASVVDSGGLGASRQVTITVLAVAGPSTPALTVRGYKVKNAKRADLTWSGITASSVDVYRNGARVLTTGNDGAHTDAVSSKGDASFSYQVCAAASTTVCTNTAAVVF